MPFRPLALVIALLASYLDSASDRRKAVPPGDWGGDQASLVVTERGARLELACAHGSIETPILVDEKGQFDMNGVFVREGPGPVRQGEDRGEPARFSGRIDQDAMTLTLERTNEAEMVGTFALERGRASRVRKCQ